MHAAEIEPRDKIVEITLLIPQSSIVPLILCEDIDSI